MTASERLKYVEDKVVLLWGQVQRHEENIENIKGQITELREQIERSFEPIDDWKMKVFEYGHRIAKLESLVYYPEQPQVGIIRRFWRWLW
jgi:peptidoglycan hydrolase CwlO-like protein